MPRWVSADTPPVDVASSLITLPECSASSLPSGWLDYAERAGARIIRGVASRDKLIAAALEGTPSAEKWRTQAFAEDFLALGFGYLVVELVTRQLRYMSNLDADRFNGHVLEAVQRLTQGDEDGVREQLRYAADRLTEAREYFYPVQTSLIDLTVVAETTLGERFRRELATETPINLLVSGSTVERMAEREPASLNLLRQRLATGSVTLVGGEYEEWELPLLPPEAIIQQIRRGLAAYDRHLGQRPTVFGRRRFGLSPLLPQILKSFGFVAALHFTLDDGRFPSGNQSKIRWEGIDGSEIDALARVPLEVHRPENFLKLSNRLGNTLDSDQGGAIVFAHWPGQTSPWFEDLRHMGRYGPVLGKFCSLTSYFESNIYAGQTARHTADKYRSPYLNQEVEAETPDPISRWVRFHRKWVLQADVQAVRTMSEATSGACSAEAEAPTEAKDRTPIPVAPGLSQPQLGGQDPGGLAPGAAPTVEADSLEPSRLAAAAECLAKTLARGQSPGGEAGVLCINPRSHRSRFLAELSALSALPAAAPPVLAVAQSEDRKQAIVEVPAMGFSWIGPGTAGQSAETPKTKAQSAQPLLVVEKNELRNEFFQARISETTGGIQSLQNYTIRGNRLAQQIAMRLPSEAQDDVDPEAEENYSLMAADEITATMLGPMAGRIVSRGRLVHRTGKSIARFVQTITARQGSPILELEIELDIDRQPEAQPWASYYAVRFAWSDETADVVQGLGLCRHATEGKVLESPHFIEIHSPRTRFTVLPAGLPYHRRFGLRKLDTLLVVRGETARSFRLGVGVDVRYPAHAALDAIASPREWCHKAAAPVSPWGWLFHLDARNVMATHWESLCENGRARGFRVRLLETEGRRAECLLRCFRPVATAQRVDFLGALVSELPVEGDEISLELQPRQWIQVEARFTEAHGGSEP